MVFLSVGKPMRLNETAFDMKGYWIWFSFKIKTKDRWAPKHVWFVSCELVSLWKWIGKNNKLDRAALICTVLPGPPNKCEISVGRIWEVLEPYNFILLIQTGAEVVVILTLHGLHCKLPGFVVLAGTAMGLHFSAAWWWEASNTPALSQARLGLEAMLSSVSDS